MKAPLRRLASFGSVTALGSLAPLLVIPAITHALGSDAWTAIAIGQSVGALLLVLVGAGWGIIGPTLLNSRDPTSWSGLYGTSVLQRGLLFLPSSVIGSLVAFAVAPDDGLLAAAMVPAVAVWGLGPVWFMIATGRPGGILLYDTGPKLVVSLVAAVLIATGVDAWCYAGGLFIAGAACVALADRNFSGPRSERRFADAIGAVAQQLQLTLSAAATATFTNIGPVLVAAVRSEAAAGYTATDRVRVLASVALASVASAVAGWIFQGGEVSGARRRVATIVVLGVGVALGLSIPILSGQIERLLFSGTIDAAGLLWWLQGLTVMTIAVGSVLTYQYLAPRGATRWIAYAAWTGFGVGVTAMLVGAVVAGAVGAGAGMLLAELAVTCVLLCGTAVSRETGST